MPGSRKGEKRGAAGRMRNAELGVEMQHAQQPEKPKRGQGERGRDRRTEDYYRQVVRYVNEDLTETEPRELMLRAMRWFEGRADEALQQRAAFVQSIAEMPPEQLAKLSPADAMNLDVHLAKIEQSITANLLQAVDVGFKVAPYVHPRLSAIAVAPATGSPSNIMGRLMQEIELLSRGKPSWQMGEVLELPAPEGSDDE